MKIEEARQLISNLKTEYGLLWEEEAAHLIIWAFDQGFESSNKNIEPFIDKIHVALSQLELELDC